MRRCSRLISSTTTLEILSLDSGSDPVAAAAPGAPAAGGVAAGFVPSATFTSYGLSGKARLSSSVISFLSFASTLI